MENNTKTRQPEMACNFGTTDDVKMRPLDAAEFQTVDGGIGFAFGPIAIGIVSGGFRISIGF